MAVPDYRPCWFDSTDAGAPELNNVSGRLIDIFEACLVLGYAVRSISQIVVTDGVAVATSAAHGYTATYGKLLLIEGASVPGLNGRVQPTAVTGNTFSYAAPGVADGTYTGSISAKRAPLGWAKPFADTGKAIFARTTPEAGPQLLRIVDTAASPASGTDARVLMIESASGIDTFTNQAPSAAQITDGHGGYINKGSNNATLKPWALVGTDRGFYFFGPINLGNSETQRLPYFFGDGVRFFPGDEHFCLLAVNSANGGGISTSKIGISNAIGANWATAGSQAAVCARSRGGAVVSEVFDPQGITAPRMGYTNAMPAGMPEKLYLVYPTHVCTNYESKEVRGALPGLAAPIASLPFTGLGAASVLGPMEGDGRAYLAVQSAVGGSNAGNYCIDLTGPWYG